MKFASLFSTLLLLIGSVQASTRYYDDYDDQSYGNDHGGAYGGAGAEEDYMFQEYADRQQKKLEAGNGGVG